MGSNLISRSLSDVDRATFFLTFGFGLCVSVGVGFDDERFGLAAMLGFEFLVGVCFTVGLVFSVGVLLGDGGGDGGGDGDRSGITFRAVAVERGTFCGPLPFLPSMTICPSCV